MKKYQQRGRQNRSWKGKKTKMQWIDLSPKELQRYLDKMNEMVLLTEEMWSSIGVSEQRLGHEKI